MKKFILTGANGFIASAFSNVFKSKYEFTFISQARINKNNCHTWNDLIKSPDILASADIVLNLAGANIGNKCWSISRKKEIINSRIQSTTILVDALNSLGHKAKLINASAVGIYPYDNNIYDENSLLDFKSYDSFAEEITKRWEGAALNYKGNLAITRFGVVLSNRGGAFKKIISPFKFGLGGNIGLGNWPFSWISLWDLLNALDLIAMQEKLNGAFNLVSPNLISYKDLILTICEVYQTKARLNLPKWFIEFIFGQMGQELLLRGQKVQPTRLMEIDFKFDYADIKSCILAIKNNVF